MSFLGESTIFFTLFDALDLRESNIIGADSELFHICDENRNSIGRHKGIIKLCMI